MITLWNILMSEPQDVLLIEPDWPVAPHVHACSTTRQISGNADCGQGAYSCCNLAIHVGDDLQQVQHNRQKLAQQLRLPAEPLWLDQVHDNKVLNAGDNFTNVPPQADAAYSDEKNGVCVVMTADCLPVLICNRKGNKVAAAHAGWRGLAAGVIEAAISRFNEKPDEIRVWLGPAIGPEVFEVGEEVYKAFVGVFAQDRVAFKASRPGHFLADIYQLARLRLKRIGVEAVYGGGFCTYTDKDRFYSYRREAKTGRQASLIWLTE
ncbi:FIG00003370: Multicopper polyphenol oxidase [hydrothermal vent metagenome]|uniref:FIG00003370: Multicopper polyphenol oxidase n=1 Tax=hydrothermal vent metagenome TaxID=652676 RepID=A0A3B0XR37_9ZZZZ